MSTQSPQSPQVERDGSTSGPWASIGRLVSRRIVRGETVTQVASTTFANDMDREARNTSPDSATPDRQAGGSEVAIAIRSQASGVHRATRKARRAERRAERAAKATRRRLRFEERVRQGLTRTRTRRWIALAEDHDSRVAVIGYLTAWLPILGVHFLMAAMVINDPGFVYTTLRDVFDVPASRGILDIRDPNILVALAAAGAVTAALLTTAHLLGKALGTLLFSGPLRNREQPEVVRTWNQVRPGRMLLTIAIGSVVLWWFTTFLHQIAVARLEQNITATIGGAEAIASSVAWFITLLPLVVTALETIASAPQLVHARKATRWSLHLRVRETIHVRRDQRLIKRERAAHRRARLTILSLTDILRDVGLRALAEIVEANLAGGQVDLSPVAYQLMSEPSADTPRLLPIDLSGAAANSYLPGLPVVSNTVADAINAYTALEPVPQVAPLAQDWRGLRDDPANYILHAQPSNQTTTTAGDGCRHGQLHGITASDETDPASDTDPAIEPAA